MIKKSGLAAATFVTALGISSGAQALEPKQCLSMADMNAALRAEGQRTLIIGDRIAAIGNTANPGVTTRMIRNVNTVTSNDDGSVGYQLEGDKSRAETSTSVCVAAKLTDIQLFDARKTDIPQAAYLGGDFNRTVDESATVGARPMLVAKTVFGSGESTRYGLPIVVFGNIPEQAAIIATRTPDGIAQKLALMNRAEYTTVALQRLGDQISAPPRTTNVAVAPVAPTPPPQAFTRTTFPEPTESKPVLLLGKEDVPSMWVVLVARTHCPKEMVRNESMTLNEGSWSTGVDPIATYCGQNLVYYMGLMPYTEFREKMNAGLVRISGKRARDFTSDMAFRVNKLDTMNIFRELERRQDATLALSAPRTGPISRYAAASTSPITAGGPSAADILSTHARSTRKYFGGNLTGVPGEVAYDSIWGGISHYDQRNIQNYGCTALSKGKYRCTYDFEKRHVADSDSQWGRGIVALLQPSHSRNTYTFIFDGKAWNSPELDAENIAAKGAASRTAQSSDDWRARAAAERAEQDEKNRKNWECRMDALRDGAMAFCF